MAAHSGALGGRLSRASPFAALVHINIHRISTPRSLRRAVHHVEPAAAAVP